eukprot:1195783-Prorocentrum_minimum.AAC.5
MLQQTEAKPGNGNGHNGNGHNGHGKNGKVAGGKGTNGHANGHTNGHASNGTLGTHDHTDAELIDVAEVGKFASPAREFPPLSKYCRAKRSGRVFGVLSAPLPLLAQEDPQTK